ncbi:MAG: hypothetical protein WBN68_15150 [Sedimenticolaceae bacterium]
MFREDDVYCGDYSKDDVDRTYRINPEIAAWVSSVLWNVNEGISGQQPYRVTQVLNKMPYRPGAPRCA